MWWGGGVGTHVNSIYLKTTCAITIYLYCRPMERTEEDMFPIRKVHSSQLGLYLLKMPRYNQLAHIYILLDVSSVATSNTLFLQIVVD